MISFGERGLRIGKAAISEPNASTCSTVLRGRNQASDFGLGVLAYRFVIGESPFGRQL